MIEAHPDLWEGQIKQLADLLVGMEGKYQDLAGLRTHNSYMLVWL
jgi:hypothetical protein